MGSSRGPGVRTWTSADPDADQEVRAPEGVMGSSRSPGVRTGTSADPDADQEVRAPRDHGTVRGYSSQRDMTWLIGLIFVLIVASIFLIPMGGVVLIIPLLAIIVGLIMFGAFRERGSRRGPG
jgi:hypothetical protein